MKRLIAAMMLISSVVVAGQWALVDGGAVSKVYNGLPNPWNGADNYLRNLTTNELHAIGFRRYSVVQPPSGEYAVGWTNVITATTAIRQPTSTALNPPQPEPEPMIMDEGLEVPYLLLQAQTNQTPSWLLYARDDGTLGVVLGHASPWDKDAVKNRIKANNATNALINADLLKDAEYAWMIAQPDPDSLKGQDRKRFQSAMYSAINFLIKKARPDLVQ